MLVMCEQTTGVRLKTGVLIYDDGRTDVNGCGFWAMRQERNAI